MFNIASSVQLLVAAEKINNSRNLTDAEKLVLLRAIADSIMAEMPGCPEHAKIVRASIERMGRNERAREAAKQGRQAEGQQDEAPVAEGRAEEGSEAPEGSPEGVSEQAEDAGRADQAEPDTAKPATGKRKAQAKA